jgi:hypothetical protein
MMLLGHREETYILQKKLEFCQERGTSCSFQLQGTVFRLIPTPASDGAFRVPTITNSSLSWTCYFESFCNCQFLSSCIQVLLPPHTIQYAYIILLMVVW